MCKRCFSSFNKNTNSKFELKNKINVPLCQNYSTELFDLIIVKKILIVKNHLIDIIFKLRRYDNNEYDELREHMIVLFQNSIHY